MTYKITRRGFRSADVPVSVKEYAEAYVTTMRDEGQNVLATLRPVTYCGPDSPGARGAYMLDVTATETGHELIIIERSGREIL